MDILSFPASAVCLDRDQLQGAIDNHTEDEDFVRNKSRARILKNAVLALGALERACAAARRQAIVLLPKETLLSVFRMKQELMRAHKKFRIATDT